MWIEVSSKCKEYKPWFIGSLWDNFLDAFTYKRRVGTFVYLSGGMDIYVEGNLGIMWWSLQRMKKAKAVFPMLNEDLLIFDTFAWCSFHRGWLVYVTIKGHTPSPTNKT